MVEILAGSLARPMKTIKTSPHIVIDGRMVSATIRFRPVIAKLLPDAQCAVELVSAWLGATVGLPVPAFGRIEVSSSCIPFGTSWPYSDEQHTAFASATVPYAKQVSSVDSYAVEARLNLWPYTELAGAFDELIANDDRSQGNLLIDGGQTIWLIDHARALGGAGDRLFSTELRPSFDNFFLHRIARQTFAERLKRKQALLHACAYLRSAVPRIPYTDLQISSTLEAEIRSWLAARLRNLEQLVLSRVGLPDLVAGSSQQPGVQ